jgi:regulator of replication initiation timing
MRWRVLDLASLLDEKDASEADVKGLKRKRLKMEKDMAQTLFRISDLEAKLNSAVKEKEALNIESARLSKRRRKNFVLDWRSLGWTREGRRKPRRWQKEERHLRRS